MEMKDRVLGVLERGVEVSLPEEEFQALALETFRLQCAFNPLYAGFVRRRGVDPRDVRRWEEIPPLPTRAFKSAPLTVGDPARAEAVFRTSGTTRGVGDRGEHYVPFLDLYRASLLPNFRTHLLPEGAEPEMIALLPDPGQAPDSSLTFMAEEVRVGLCGGRGRFFVDRNTGIRSQDLRRALEEAEGKKDGVLLLGTAFAFAQWLDTVRDGGQEWRFTLGSGSRIMETGGFKGRVRSLSRDDLYGGLAWAFGIDSGRIVNEYGMTELLSQFYEPVLLMGGGEELSRRYHRGPPWARTQVLHPLTLVPVPEGETGILAHFDLANLGSVAAILTDDLGTLVPGGFRLLGRNPGSEPRGCSLAMEDFLAHEKGRGYVL